MLMLMLVLTLMLMLMLGWVCYHTWTKLVSYVYPKKY